MTPDRIEFTAEARDDLDGLLGYLSARNPGAALRSGDAVDAALGTLVQRAPRVDGREVMLPSGTGCRRWFVHPAVVV